jgi:leader peptidase (prepilin peptidase) / N-methyltransferase
MLSAFVQEHPTFAGVWSFILGSVFGSFLNVCAYRIPREQSMWRPGSRCPSCSAPIPWRLNTPIFSWLLLRGKAACCASRIASRYLIVEALTGAAFAWAVLTFGGGAYPEKALVALVFAFLLIGAALTDLESFIIPDRFSIGGALLGLALAFFFPAMRLGVEIGGKLEHFQSGLDALLGMLVGSASLYWIGLLAEKAMGKEALGEGDVKLLGCIGAFCGWQGALFAIFAGALIGTIILLPVAAVQGRWKSVGDQSVEQGKKVGWGVEVPFGPFLATAALAYHFGLFSLVDPWFENFRMILASDVTRFSF